MKLPEEINILGVVYKVSYVDKPSDVDIYKRESLWGQIDYWTRSIRIYNGGDRPEEDVWQVVIHEVMHGIANDLHLKPFDDPANHDDLDVLSLALVDVIFRNGWMKTDAIEETETSK